MTLFVVIRHLIKYPFYAKKFGMSAAYFIYLTFTYEIMGQVLKWWIFPNLNMIGWITLSKISFPLEELIFWIALSSLAVLTFYQNFNDGIENA